MRRRMLAGAQSRHDLLRLLQKSKKLLLAEIRKRRVAQEALLESEHRFRSLIENSADAYLLIDEQAKTLYVGPSITRVLGFTEAEYMAVGGLTQVHPDDLAVVTARLSESIKTPGVTHFLECRIKHKDGSWRWVEAAGTNLLTEPSVKAIVVNFRDITERKKAQDQILRSQQRLRLHIQDTPLGVIGWDMDFRAVEWNKAAEKIFGYSEAEAMGMHARQIIPESVWPHVDEIWLALITQSGGTRSVNENIAKDGRLLTIQWYNTALIDSAGNVIGVASLVEDVTERRKAQMELQRAHDELELRVAERTRQLLASNKELEAFSYSVSHDLRAPLRAVDGFARLLQEDYKDKLDETGQRFIRNICDSTRHMGQLIDDLLAFSRLVRQKMSFIPISIEELIREVVNEVQKFEVGREVQVTIAPLPAICGDRAMLRQVFVNLISNAFKFTRRKAHGEIEIGFENRENEVAYFIRDNGAGFDMEYSSKLFGVFQRLHTTDEFDGTGVGLAIAKRVIERHGGRIWAEGKVGLGATFYVALPKQPVVV